MDPPDAATRMERALCEPADATHQVPENKCRTTLKKIDETSRNNILLLLNIKMTPDH